MIIITENNNNKKIIIITRTSTHSQYSRKKNTTKYHHIENPLQENIVAEINQDLPDGKFVARKRNLHFRLFP